MSYPRVRVASCWAIVACGALLAPLSGLRAFVCQGQGSTARGDVACKPSTKHERDTISAAPGGPIPSTFFRCREVTSVSISGETKT